MSRTSSAVTAIATVFAATLLFRKPASVQIVSAMGSAQASLIRAAIGSGADTSTKKTSIGGLTQNDLEWIQWNLTLAEQSTVETQ